MIIVDGVFLVLCLVLWYRRVSIRVPVGLLCVLTRSSFSIVRYVSSLFIWNSSVGRTSNHQSVGHEFDPRLERLRSLR